MTTRTYLISTVLFAAVLLSAAAQGERKPQEAQNLWWLYSKYVNSASLPERLFIPPEAILPLSDG
jgi:hypothetical protein